MQETYDYIVIGAGSAGCILADRLSEDEAADVLILEAGVPDDHQEIKNPMEFGHLMKTDVDWDYTSVPQEHMHGREIYQPRGKVLGGSSSLNAMIYFRGHPADYDRWAALGNDGWSWDEMLPRFKRAEHFEGGASAYRGTGGKLNIKKQENTTGLADSLYDAARAVGFEHNDDLNGGEMTGIGSTQVNIKDGKRHSTADAYLRPALSRGNLDGETGALVTELHFDGTRVTGVTVEIDGQEQTVGADREVILSAGVFESPHLLLCSGIGDPGHLREHDIDVVADVPGVGKNLQDHLMGVLTYETAKPFELGPGEHMTQNIAFEHDDPDTATPDLVYFQINALFMNHGFDNPEDTQGYTIGFHMCHAESTGDVRLNSADPHDAPRIDMGYLSDEADLDRLVRGLKRAREMGEAAPADEYRGEEIWPGADVQSDEEIAEYLRETAQTGYHPIGTCKMGTDEMAVVDDRLRVKGVDGLRVVDASVMPFISVANTQGAVIGIAERAADMIKNGS